MENIFYRHYEIRDEEHLGILFNKTFQINGSSIFRTPKIVKLRYIQPSEFKPKMIQIKEDKHVNKFVRGIYVISIEKILINRME